MVDDNPFILDAWADTLKPEAIVHLLESPESLADKVASDPLFLAGLVAVITDNLFDGSSGDGFDVGRLVKSHRPTLTVLLSSDGEFRGVNLGGVIDRIIDKDPVSVRELGLG